MNTETPNPNPVNTLPRCQYMTPKGRQCRERVRQPEAAFCWRHLHPRACKKPIPDLAALALKLREFNSAAQVHEFLAAALVSFAQKRTTPREAAVFAYLCNMLLRTLTHIQLEEKEAEENAPLQVDWSNIPRPDRSEPEDPYAGSDTMRQIAQLVPGFVVPGKEAK